MNDIKLGCENQLFWPICIGKNINNILSFIFTLLNVSIANLCTELLPASQSLLLHIFLMLQNFQYELSGFFPNDLNKPLKIRPINHRILL